MPSSIPSRAGKAVLSMDVEDWYHLDYLLDADLDRSASLLDGWDRYVDFLDQHNFKTTFFVLGELVSSTASRLRELQAQGHEIACHGFAHRRPLTLPVDQFREELTRAKQTLEDCLGAPVIGYRAPCYSLDRTRLDIIRETGFLYDSSKIAFSDHPLYGDLDVKDFQPLAPTIFRSGGFFEFEISTLPYLGRQVPVSGGGYIRIFPWMLMGNLIRKYLKAADLYVLYIHPFELSPAPTPFPRSSVSASQYYRFSIGRSSVRKKLDNLALLLRASDFKTTTFSELRSSLLGQE
jgi:polysaccharide deacetylase family protein (PEP-CTERM system associated)